MISPQAYLGIQHGYIILPADVDRTRFIEQCYRWERVSILVEKGGGVIHDCYITKTALQEINFPESSDKLGSCVVFFTEIHSGLPVIIGVASKENESQWLGEGKFRFVKTYQNTHVTIEGDAKNGALTLSVGGDNAQQLNITIANKAKNTELNLRCQGVINLAASGGVRINKGTEPMIKGNELKTQLDKTNDYLSNLYQAIYQTLQLMDAVVPGVSAAFETAMLGKNPGDYSNVQSEESFLD